jgi:biopolymer transport protein ExbD
MASGAEGEPEFQIAPMIDVLLVLLIFFMSITSAQVLRVDQAISLPVADHGIKKDSMRAEAIVNVRWQADTAESVYSFDDRTFENLDQLSEALAAAKKASERAAARRDNPEFRVVIRGDRDGTVSGVTRAMNAAAAAGIADISFSTINKE